MMSVTTAEASPTSAMPGAKTWSPAGIAAARPRRVPEELPPRMTNVLYTATAAGTEANRACALVRVGTGGGVGDPGQGEGSQVAAQWMYLSFAFMP